jgi:hypothetical protein
MEHWTLVVVQENREQCSLGVGQRRKTFQNGDDDYDIMQCTILQFPVHVLNAPCLDVNFPQIKVKFCRSSVFVKGKGKVK